MKNVFALAVIPLICMGATILTALVIIVALRRGTKKINAQAEEIISQRENGTRGNTRWARGDLKGEETNIREANPMKSCSACGGENPASSSTCSFCGRQI